MRRIIALCALILFPVLGSRSWAAVPSTVNFQGKLLNTTNVPQNGTFNLTFTIWNALTGGAQLWTETQSGVPVSNGVFSVQLGAANPLSESVFSSPSAYLAITLGGNTFSPREQLLTSPYAFYASSADAAAFATSAASAQTAQYLASGDTNYIQMTSVLQSGATFYVSSGTITGPLTVYSSVTASAFFGNGANITSLTAGNISAGTLGIANGGTGQATAPAALTALGGSSLSAANTFASSQTFIGDVQINGNINDNTATNRIILGDPLIFNAGTNGLGVPAGQPAIMLSTSVFFSGTPNVANYIAYPFTAKSTITSGEVVILIAGGVETTTTAHSTAVIGFAVTGAASGATVWVATSGIITNAIAGVALTTVGTPIGTYTTAGRIETVAAYEEVIGKTLTTAAAAGDTISIVIIGS